MTNTPLDEQRRRASLRYGGLLSLGQELQLAEELLKAGHLTEGNHDNQRLILTREGEIIALPNRNVNQLHKAFLRLADNYSTIPNRKTFTQIAKLTAIKKISYRPLFEPVIAFGIAQGEFYNTSVGFYRAIHHDTQPVLNLNPLWFAIPAFTAFLDKHLNSDGLHTSFESINNLWVSKEHRMQQWNSDKVVTYREMLHGGTLSLDFNEELQKYEELGAKNKIK